MFGFAIYYLIPLSLLSLNLSLFFNIFFLILLGMLFGLVVLALNMEILLEKAVVCVAGSGGSGVDFAQRDDTV